MCPSSEEYVKRWRITRQIVDSMEKGDMHGVLLVGSVAREDCYESSDIDLMVVEDEKRRYPDRWVGGVPVTTACLTVSDVMNASDVLKSELLCGRILYDPYGKIDEVVQRIRDELDASGLDEKGLKLNWLSRVSAGYKGHADEADDPYSVVAWYRAYTFYQTSRHLLEEHGVWKPRPRDYEQYLGAYEEPVEGVMSFQPLLERKNTVQSRFEEFEDQLLVFAERHEDRISSDCYEMVKHCVSDHKSRLSAFHVERGDWLSGIFGYRNYVNELYSWPLSEAYNVKPTEPIGKLMEIGDPQTFTVLCKEINCFKEDIWEQLAELRKSLSKLDFIQRQP
jgi:hypothetical protein